MTAFRIITALCVLALAYIGFEWARIGWMVRDAYTPKAAFLIIKDDGKMAVNEFIDYRCNNCAAFYKATSDLIELNPDLSRIVRPLMWIDEESENLVRLVMAAGLEGKFDVLHDAFLERNGAFDEPFLRETISLYGMDYDALLERSQSAEVDALIDDNERDAIRLGVSSVPSLMIGPVYYKPPGPIEDLTATHFLPALAQARENR